MVHVEGYELARERVNDKLAGMASDVQAVREVPRLLLEARAVAKEEIARVASDARLPVDYRRAAVQHVRDTLRQVEADAAAALARAKAQVKANRTVRLTPPPPTPAELAERAAGQARAAQLEGRFRDGRGDYAALGREIATAMSEGRWAMAAALVELGMAYQAGAATTGARAGLGMVYRAQAALAERAEAVLPEITRKAMAEVALSEATRIPSSEDSLRQRFKLGPAPEPDFPTVPAPPPARKTAFDALVHAGERAGAAGGGA